MADALVLSLTPERLIEILQSKGYRAELFQDASGDPHLRSSSTGVPFNVRFGNRAPPPVEGYYDFTFITLIKIDAEFPLERINAWNQNRRFARLHRSNDFLVLDMDVILAGGVGEDHLRGTVELWDRMLQELMNYLRGDAPGGAANAA
jgi:hypothetical protein